MIEINDLSVLFGGVKPINRLSITFAAGTCGLIGPNGAGKTTLLNVFSGFVTPATGSVRAFGEDLLRLAPHRRARWGLRRTFQTEQAIRELSIYDNVAMAYENTAGRGSRDRGAVHNAIDFVGLMREPTERVDMLAAGERRLIELARAVVGRPRLILLDEPAAGLPESETEHLGSVIRRIPTEFGALVILIDHDMSLVSACCTETAVLDFGQLIASGPTDEVLRDERVITAYLGDEEL
jgi:branched-chain amino acid transport system ATP-binding protein